MKGGGKQIIGLDMNLLRRFFPYLRKTAWLGVVSFTLMILSNLASVLQPYFVKIGIDKDIAGRDWPGLMSTVWTLGIVLLCGFFFQFLYNLSIQLLGQRLLYDLRLDLFKKLLSLSQDYFDRTPVGK